ncbi:N-acetylmuramoyl-L-alanine amidase [Metabacillus sp. Hm71]|uniref:N-acetylmuramoyl-L-alanine amidase n=1 Tax=Metabacillus sp. Hm71 TaxID=3450743 RepID=UPI003F423B5A
MFRKYCTMYICFTLLFIASFAKTVTLTAANEQVTINVDHVNVRSGAGLTSSIIAKVKKGQTFDVVEKKNDWIKIELSRNETGWVASWLVKEKSSSTSSNSSVSNGNVISNATSLRIRSGPGTSFSVIGVFDKGKTAQYLEKSGRWIKISYSGKSGWVAGWHISKTTNTSAATVNPSTNSKHVKIIYNGTNIRSGASTGHSIVKRANAGETYTLLDTVGNWYKINLENDKIGYIAGWVVETSGINSPVTKPGSGLYVKNKTIVIDPGHGGQDSGAVGTRGTLEKNITLVTAKLVYNKLRSAGANVFLTRTNDTYISLQSRVSTSHYRNADAFISLHYDSTSDRSASGTTTYYYNSLKDSPLAARLNSSIAQQSNLRDRGLKFGNFHVLRENKAAAALVELGFLSNRTEELTINTSNYQERISQGIFNGLALYFK